PPVVGHAVEARLYAEDVAAGFLPSTGTLTWFEVPDGVRVDSGVEAGSVVSVHYDAMLAKVVAHGPTREVASRVLADALARTRVHGVTTNRDLLVQVLRSDAWRDGEVDTGHLDRAADLGTPLLTPEGRRLHAVAAALAGAALRRSTARVLAGLPSGWRNVPSEPSRASFGDVVVTYAQSRDGVSVTVDGERLGVVVLSAAPDLVDLETDGVRRRFRVALDGLRAHVDSPLGSCTLLEDDPWPPPGSTLAAGSLTAPMPGTVLRVEVAAGQQVQEGQVLLVLEAMKMEHSVRAPADGSVTTVAVEAGQQVEAGSVLVVVEGGVPG
ncbi:MAG: accA2, partial [Frankiales bacterium]|nr:accA2 [Frankiales bacterium]